MKRRLVIDYDSSAESSDESQPISQRLRGGSHESASKRPCLADTKSCATSALSMTSLPVLRDVFEPSIPKDDPSLHQGRRRTKPHVEGQFAAYVYAPVSVSDSQKRTFQKALSSMRTTVPELYSLLPEDDDECLHISLSRPLYLRAHQREDLMRQFKLVASQHTPFQVSFAQFTSLENDDRSRVFVALEVGAGHNELKALSDALTPYLQNLRQASYYSSPRFHSSVAWALLRPSDGGDDGTINEEDAGRSQKDFPAITGLPNGLLPDLESEWGSSVRKHGRLSVTELHVKIGRRLSRFSL